jgi:pimeloyl-ACP methyl ester carboxylesterase
MISTIFAAALLAAAAPVIAPIEVKGPQGQLAGTLVAPVVAVAPVVLIIPGSGPTDRDGNNPGGIKAAPYRLVAEGLAAHGIASVRIDKRGMFGSRDAVADPNAVAIPDYVADVRAWIGAIRERTGTRCVWLLGHSEGALVALAAAQDATDICGLLLVSAPGRTLGEVMRGQLRANPANAPILAQAEGAIDALEAGRTVDTSGMHPALQQLFAPPVQEYLKNIFTYDPAKLIAAVRRPVLVLQGLRDIQVSETDARLLAAADPAAKLALLSDANHVLKAAPSNDMAAQIAIYGDPNLPLAPGVIDALVGFIEENHDGR